MVSREVPSPPIRYTVEIHADAAVTPAGASVRRTKTWLICGPAVPSQATRPAARVSARYFGIRMCCPAPRKRVGCSCPKEPQPACRVTPTGGWSSGLMRVYRPLPLTSRRSGLMRRRSTFEPGRCSRRQGSAGHRGLDLAWKAHEIAQRTAGLNLRPHQPDGLGTWDAERGQRSSDLQRHSGGMTLVCGARDRRYVRHGHPGGDSERADLDGLVAGIRDPGV